ncbi:isochorismatase family protein [Paenibacillus antri]|uniref:Isochorismatase family protein n=1 Tax=Paenibacillus antri TaxID=2582848 RepID=A0A5R9G8P0_9BACL|nr:isochorismatase family cysteine hydrolase [Paenibacillus antri]TLS52091.1 isochorismatase family protein [Paenibacillus antri]
MNKLGHAANHWTVSKEHVDLRRSARRSRVVEFAAEPQRLTLDLSKSALVIVDMQNDFCSASGWLDYIGADYAPARAPIEPINRLAKTFREDGVPIVWLNWGNRPDRMNLSPSVLHVYNAAGDDVGIGGPLPGNGSRVLEKGSWGASIVDELEAAPTDIHVDKYRMSGFWDTPLDSILRNLRVDTLFFAGVNVDQCVMATLQDAVCLGYDSVLLRDCSATTSPAFCAEATMYNVKQCYGFVADSTAVLAGREAAPS